MAKRHYRIAGYPSETVTIAAAGRATPRFGLRQPAPAYLIFQDLIIDMINATLPDGRGGPNGIYLSSGAHHNRFERLEVKNNQGNRDRVFEPETQEFHRLTKF